MKAERLSSKPMRPLSKEAARERRLTNFRMFAAGVFAGGGSVLAVCLLTIRGLLRAHGCE